jgi:hypothetical protein
MRAARLERRAPRMNAGAPTIALFLGQFRNW